MLCAAEMCDKIYLCKQSEMSHVEKRALLQTSVAVLRHFLINFLNPLTLSKVTEGLESVPAHTVLS